jgi:hypothetical protein
MTTMASTVLDDPDIQSVRAWMANPPDTESVANFVPGPGIERLNLAFDVAKLRTALDEALSVRSWHGESFRALPLTRRPGVESVSANDLSGRYWMRRDERYVEEPMEDLVDEAAFSEFEPAFAGTYFEHVHTELAKRFTIGRMRVLAKDIYTCNSWHRDPEPRLHIPIITNPGSLFIVNHHVTHLPADGSVFFTDTRGYHTALNGGGDVRVHIVAALVR